MSNFADDPLTVLDALSDPVAVVDERMLITGVNQAALNLVGATSPEALIGLSGLELVHEPDRIDAVERLAALADRRQASPVSLRITRLDGSLVWVEITGGVFTTSSGATRSVLSFRNVDWRHEADLDAARVVRRAHSLVTAALALQSSSPEQLPEMLDAVSGGVANAVGAEVVSIHEVEPDGATLTLRSRWVSSRASREARIHPAHSVPLEHVPNWVNALNSTRHSIVTGDDRHGEQADLTRIDHAAVNGVSLALNAGERLLGSLTVGLPENRQLSADESDFLEQAAEIVGAALHRIRGQQALIESESMFRDLFEGSSAILYLVDPETLQIVEANAAAANFYGYSRSAMAGMELRELTFHTRDELVALVEGVRAGGTTIIDERQRLANGEERTVEIHSTPMRLNNRVLDLAIVQDVTEQRRAVAELERLAATDDLTGVHNRRQILQLVQEEIVRSQRYNRPFVLLMLDLDHFKAVNDLHGHLAGDSYLVAFTEQCSALLRANDHLGRLGGEEFAVLLPESDLADAEALSERIRLVTEKLTVPEINGPPPCTVSIGGAQWESGWTSDELFARADRMLYRAKQAGRNRFER